MAMLSDLDVTCPACDETIAVPLSLSKGIRAGNELLVTVSGDTWPLRMHLAMHMADEQA